MIDPHKTKYHDMYWDWAHRAALESPSERHKVGAVIVTRTGMISAGWNGMPAGLTNQCENRQVPDEKRPGKTRGKTDPRVIHAERNAIDKMTRQGVALEGAVLFVTLSPCLECAKALHGLGLSAVIYDQLHDCTEGLTLLKETGTPVYSRRAVYQLDIFE